MASRRPTPTAACTSRITRADSRLSRACGPRARSAYLLNQIRLNGEKQELVDTIVRLSIRYGIITPYTSYLIQENDIRAQGGEGGGPVPGTPVPLMPPPMQPRTAGGGAANGNQPATSSSGASAVDEAQKSNAQAGADTVMAAPTASAPQISPKDKQPSKGTGSANEPIKQVNDRTFILRGGIWTDTLYTSDKMKLVPVIFLSDDYFKLLDAHPEIKDYLAIGDHVVIVIGDTAYEIKPQ